MSNNTETAFSLSKKREDSLLFYHQRLFDSIQDHQHPDSASITIGNLRNAAFQLEAARDENTLNSPNDIALRKQRMHLNTQLGEQLARRVDQGITELDTGSQGNPCNLVRDRTSFLTIDKLKEKSNFFDTLLSKIPNKQSLSNPTPFKPKHFTIQPRQPVPNQGDHANQSLDSSRQPNTKTKTYPTSRKAPLPSRPNIPRDHNNQTNDTLQDDDQQNSTSAFVSAKNVWRQNKHRQNGGDDPYSNNYAPNRPSSPVEDDDGDPNASWRVYGTSKSNGGYHPVTSLNAPQKKKKSGRRSFVPPLKSNKEKRKREEEQADEAQPAKKRKKPTGSNNNKDGKSNILDELFPDGEIPERMKNLDPNMIEMICNEILDHGKPVRWDDIAGLRHAKRSVVEMVVWPLQRPDLFQGLRDPPKGLLLFGPPGTGKTLIGKAIAYESGATFFNISASSLLSKWIGEGEKMVRTLFAVASHFEPAVIFIDEIDSLLSARSEGEQDASRRIKTEFLVQLDGAGTDDRERILVIGATNRPQEIDEAARRRLVKKLYIPLPDEEARKELVATLLKKEKHDIGEQELEQVMKRSEGYSGADIKALCTESALGPLRDITNITEISAESVRPILMKDFDNAFRQVRASVNQEDLNQYLEWNEKYGSAN
eukprot:gb/GECH01008256.1/.p1 GENE.gb/GECH01008256.1/~~gb/GECH01008256.1/.p1  ORF type:complete len:652 (+),score=141.17 gb/GECH01008256.1/:1-1956(+)